MKRIPENFNNLHFTEASFFAPEVDGRTISIPVQNLLPMMGHPLMADGIQFLSGKLIFRGVVKSKRSLTEYIGDPKNPEGFKEEYTVDDLPPLSDEADACRMYLFEGVQEKPMSWVDWDILAESFELVVE